MEYFPSASPASLSLPVSYLGQPSPPQPSTVPANIPFSIMSPDLPIIKPGCTPISIPMPAPVPNIPLVVELPAKLYKRLEQPPYQHTDDLVDTCSNCHQTNTLWRLRMKELIDICIDNSELINYLKKTIVFRRIPDSELPTLLSNNISYPQQPADLYKSSNLDANANEFTPSQKNKTPKADTSDLGKYDVLDHCEIPSQTMDSMDSGAAESAVDSGVHDSGVSDSGVLDTTPLDSVSEMCIQNENGPAFPELHHSTENLKTDTRHAMKSKRGKKKSSKPLLDTDNQTCRQPVDNNQNYKESKYEPKLSNVVEVDKSKDSSNSIHTRGKVLTSSIDRTQNGPRSKYQDCRAGKRSDYHFSNHHVTYSDQHRNSKSSSSLRNNCAEKYRKTSIDSVVREMEGDLFTVNEEYSLAHCVAEDFRMGAGIAVHFKKEFGRVGELLDQRKRVGDVAFLKKGDRYIYYLITKRRSHMKPTLETMENSLKSLRRLCTEHNVKKLAMPVIGCGLDKLNWDDVRYLINSEFQSSSIDIVVYHYKETESNTDVLSNKARSLKIKEEPYPLVNIESNTALVVYGSADGYVDKTCKQLNTKYPFVEKYTNLCRKQEADVGEFLPIYTNQEYVCVFIIRKCYTDPFQFNKLTRCIQNFNKFLVKEKYQYVGIEPVEEDTDSLINDKIITIFRNHLIAKVELYVCNKKKENECSTSTS